MLSSRTVFTLAVATVLILAGCATQGYKKADKAGTNLEKFRSDVVGLKEAVDNSVASLNKIEEAAATDPRGAFEAYSKSLARLESSRKTVQKRAEAIRAEGEAYFQAWQTRLETINNPEIRKVSQERKEELSKTFDGLKPLIEEAKQNLDPLISDLNDLSQYLGQDLTAEGIRAAKSPIKDALDQGAKAQSTLDELVKELGAVSDAMTAARAEEGSSDKSSSK